jgi:hypothetical protein
MLVIINIWLACFHSTYLSISSRPCMYALNDSRIKNDNPSKVKLSIEHCNDDVPNFSVRSDLGIIYVVFRYTSYLKVLNKHVNLQV